MHSPDEGSPISTDSESSPPPEEVSGVAATAASQIMDFAAQMQRTLQGSKRRLPGGPSFSQSSNRDSKTRRKGDHGPRGAGVGHSNSVGWSEATLEKREKAREERDLVDVSLVEQLRKDIGDPFLERDPNPKRQAQS